MQLTIDGKAIELAQPTVQQVMNLIQKQLQADRYYNCLIVDGKYIYDDYQAYISEHLPEISELELVTQTFAQMLYNNLVTARNYLDRTLAELPGLADHFYSSPSAADWQEFVDFLQGMAWIGKLAEAIAKNQADVHQSEHFLQLFTALEAQLKELEEAIKVKDTVAVADSVQYELLPQLDQLKNAIGTMMVREGETDDPA